MEILRNNRRIIVIISAFILGIIVLLLLFFRITTATIYVTTDANATIFSKQGSEGFKQIGKGSATVSTRDSAQVIVEARLNGQVVQKPVKPQANRTVDVNLTFQPLVDAKFIAPGPLMYPFIEGNFIYGINSHTNTLAVFPINNTNTVKPVIPSIPFISQVLWQSATNFLYVTLGRGAGLVQNNKVLEDEVFEYSSVGVGNNDPVGNGILLGKDGYYFAAKMNMDDAKKLSGFVQNSTPQVYADTTYLYAVSLINNPPKNEDDVTVTSKETQMQIYDQNGNQKYSATLPITTQTARVLAISQDTIVLLHNDGITLYNVNTKQSTLQLFSFGQVRDMILYNNRLILMGTDGLWQYNTNLQEYYKVATYPEHQEYVPNSLTILGGNLVFSTSVTNEAILKDSGPNVQSGLYKVAF